jgi:hypothetical protein
MLVIWLGALFVVVGLVFMMAQPIWRGRLSEARRRCTSSAVPRDTLEPHTLASSAWCRVFTESELAWPRTYRARRHSLTGVGWPGAVAAIAVSRLETLPSRARPTLYLRAAQLSRARSVRNEPLRYNDLRYSIRSPFSCSVRSRAKWLL